jgi:hypothetical protein
MEIKDNEVRSEKHSSEVYTNSINRAIEKASKDTSFIDTEELEDSAPREGTTKQRSLLPIRES